MRTEPDHAKPPGCSPLRGCGLVALGLIVLGLALAVLVIGVDRRDPSPPSPRGLVLRTELPEVALPFAQILVEPAPDGSSAFVVSIRSDGSSSMVSTQYPYPAGPSAGERELVGYTPAIQRELPLDPYPLVTSPLFDLDGDGIVDRVIQEWADRDTSIVRVRSGADGRLLFTDRDELEYESANRAFPLGDLDGDGFGELAIAYPRADRSYDIHPADLFFGGHSWVVVVSGSAMGFKP